MNLLEVANLSKRFGGLMAIHDVSLSMAEGEILGLIGPNGAGKTTLFNILSGFLPPDRGDLRLLGASIRGLKPHQIARRGMVRTFQIVKPFLRLSVLENVRVAALNRTGDALEAEARARQVLAFVGLEEKAPLLARGLTLADRKRLELARALATQPQLLLLDEVMAGLNPTETGRMVALLQEVNAGGVSILLIEHVMRAVMALCRRIVALNYGEVIAAGPPEAIARDPRVIEAYLGEEYLRAQA